MMVSSETWPRRLPVLLAVSIGGGGAVASDVSAPSTFSSALSPLPARRRTAPAVDGSSGRRPGPDPERSLSVLVLPCLLSPFKFRSCGVYSFRQAWQRSAH